MAMKSCMSSLTSLSIMHFLDYCIGYKCQGTQFAIPIVLEATVGQVLNAFFLIPNCKF